MNSDASKTLQDALASIRVSKNAGPFTVTFDLFFKDRQTYTDVVEQHVITKEVVGALVAGLEPHSGSRFSSSSPPWPSRSACLVSSPAGLLVIRT